MRRTPEQDKQRAIGLFAKPSAEFVRLNSCRGCGKLQCVCGVRPVEKRSSRKPARKISAPALNKTEQRWQDAHPAHIAFPMSLRWGKCMTYKPDFLQRSNYFPNALPPVVFEVKGAHIYDRDIVRFKGCAAEWSWLFEFQMWQWKNATWTRLY